MAEVPDDPLLDHDGLGLAALVRNGEVTPWDLLDAAMSRVGRLDGILNAVIVDCADRARAGRVALRPGLPARGGQAMGRTLGTHLGEVPVSR